LFALVSFNFEKHYFFKIFFITFKITKYCYNNIFKNKKNLFLKRINMFEVLKFKLEIKIILY